MFVMSVLLFCILAVFVYLYDFATTYCFNLAFALQDFNKRFHIPSAVPQHLFPSQRDSRGMRGIPRHPHPCAALLIHTNTTHTDTDTRHSGTLEATYHTQLMTSSFSDRTSPACAQYLHRMMNVWQGRF